MPTQSACVPSRSGPSSRRLQRDLCSAGHCSQPDLLGQRGGHSHLRTPTASRDGTRAVFPTLVAGKEPPTWQWKNSLPGDKILQRTTNSTAGHSRKSREGSFLMGKEIWYSMFIIIHLMTGQEGRGCYLSAASARPPLADLPTPAGPPRPPSPPSLKVKGPKMSPFCARQALTGAPHSLLERCGLTPRAGIYQCRSAR